MLIKQIHDTVRELSNDDISGALGKDTFNININLAQKWLQDFYIERFVAHRMVEEAMKPMLRQKSINIVNSKVSFPDDYRYLIELGLLLSKNPDDCEGEPSMETFPILEMLPGEKNSTISSALRAPSMAKGIFRYMYASDGLRVYPDDMTGRVVMDYFIDPPEAVYGASYDPINNQESYDEAASTDLIWPVSELDNFVDLMLVISGITIRQSELMSWVRNKDLINS